LGIGPNPQSPIPNPQSPIPILIMYKGNRIIIYSFNYNKIKLKNSKIRWIGIKFVELFNKEYLKENKVSNVYDFVIVDDCSTCSEKVLAILKIMIGKKIPFYKV
jgi:hypothetical protein